MNRISKLAPLGLSAGLAFASIAGCGEHQVHVTPPTSVFFTEVSQVGSSRSREFTGTVHAHVESDVGFRTGGKMLRRVVEVGERVEAGQVIATLDPVDYELGVASADAQVRQARAQAELDSTDQARFGRLTTDGSIAAADSERQGFKAQASDARLDQAQRQLQVSRNLASYATLVSPFNGVITAIRAEAGQVVAAGQPVVTIAREGDREIVADIPEGMIADIRTLQAQVRPWDGQGGRVALKLREVSPLASVQGRLYRIKYSAARQGADSIDAWPLGSTATLALQYPAKPVVLLPISAIVNAGSATVVWTVDPRGERLVALPVRIVASDSDSVSVEGVPEHTRIVTVGAQKLDAGMKVHAIERRSDEAMKVARSAT